MSKVHSAFLRCIVRCDKLSSLCGKKNKELILISHDDNKQYSKKIFVWSLIWVRENKDSRVHILYLIYDNKLHAITFTQEEEKKTLWVKIKTTKEWTEFVYIHGSIQFCVLKIKLCFLRRYKTWTNEYIFTWHTHLKINFSNNN